MLRVEQGKTGQVLEIALEGRLLELIDSAIGAVPVLHKPIVHRSDGEPYTYSGITSMLTRAQAKARKRPGLEQMQSFGFRDLSVPKSIRAHGKSIYRATQRSQQGEKLGCCDRPMRSAGDREDRRNHESDEMDRERTKEVLLRLQGQIIGGSIERGEVLFLHAAHPGHL